MARVGTALLRRVVNLAALEGGKLGIGRLIQHGDLPAQLDRVIFLFPGSVGAGENLWPGPGVEDMVDRRGGAVVKVRSRGPDTVQGRRLIAVVFQDVDGLTVGANLLAEPTLVEKYSQLGQERL